MIVDLILDRKDGEIEMLRLNNKKFARSDKEFVASLFHKDNTCVGYYKLNKKSISIMDMQKNKVGVIVNNVLGKATKLDNGKYWYSYGDIDIVGKYSNYKDKNNDIDKAMELLNSN